MLLTFPNFNLFSMPLLILVVQGYLFAFLLLRRYWKKSLLPDVFLALICAITAYQCTSYTIGFMDWYDTYRNTKINYYLFSVGLAVGPTVYFYVRTITRPKLGFQRKDWLHYLPQLIWLVYEIFMWLYDSSLPTYWDQQNGWWKENINSVYVSPFQQALVSLSKILYYAFSIQLFWKYRQRLQTFFSNTYRVQLNWLGNFLVIYCIALFSIQYVLGIVNNFIVELHWQQNWWAFLAAALTAYYLGMKGYFTDISSLLSLTEKAENEPLNGNDRGAFSAPLKEKIQSYMEAEQPYLDPDLTLADLAAQLEISTHNLSQMINTGFGKNFNDFVNNFRVGEVKKRLKAGEQKQKSLLGIALDSGFNSKATFNRTFKKFTEVSPSEYSKQLGSN